jgi:hypothetical protein
MIDFSQIGYSDPSYQKKGVSHTKNAYIYDFISTIYIPNC